MNETNLSAAPEQGDIFAIYQIKFSIFILFWSKKADLTVRNSKNLRIFHL